MHTLEHELQKFTTPIQFRSGGNGSSFGRYRGFPVGVSISGVGDSRVVLIHVRYTTTGAAPSSPSSIRFGEPLDAYLVARMAEVTVEDGIGWLTLFDVSKDAPHGILQQLLDALLDGLEGAGVPVEATKCQYCHRRDVDELTFAEGRVAQICSVCLFDRIGKQTIESRSTKGARRAFALCIPAIAASASIWCGILWVADRFSDFQPLMLAQRVIPHPFNLIPYGVAALAACAPIAFAIRLAPELGERPAKRLAGAAALLALLLGEVIRGVPLPWNHESFPIVAQKLAFAICLVCLSMHFCTKRSPTLRL